MRLKHLASTAIMLGAFVGTASALTPYPFENYTEVPDGQAEPFVGNWSVRIAGQPGRTISTCAIPLEIKESGARSITYRAPNDPEAKVDLINENGRTTWLSAIEDDGFLAVWISADSFYLYDEKAPDMGGPYAFTRCN